MDEIKSFDSLMESTEKIEGIASALGNKDGTQVTINSVQSEIELQDKMEKLERTLSKIATMELEKHEKERQLE
jgi:hypothetical protein